MKNRFIAAACAALVLSGLNLFSAAFTAPSPYPTYRANSYEFLGYNVRTNQHYAVMPANCDVRTLNWYCDNKVAKLYMYVPVGYLQVTQTLAAGVGSNILCDVGTGDYDETYGLIIYQRSNNWYQVSRTLGSVHDGGILISNRGVYGTLINPVYSNDLVYVCTIYSIGNVPLDAASQPIPVMWNGSPLYGGQGSYPLGFEVSMSAGNSLSNLFLTVSGLRYP